MKNTWTAKKYFITAIDPLHIGSGGERLGRVDAMVIRDPISNVPKIPGTTLSGALKFFLDLALRNEGKTNICASTCGSAENNVHDHAQCPVCAAFGYATKKTARQGILQFSDADLLAYPVNTLAGPVWITTAGRLQELCGLGDGCETVGDKFLPVVKESPAFKNPSLNFGWVLLERSDAALAFSAADLEKCNLPKKYIDRLVIVSEFVFANLVNANMDVRTSVVINPETGAAKSSGLFTFEAVAKGAIFVFTLTENDFADIWSTVACKNKSANATEMIEAKAFPGVGCVGIGGMTTRGFGRLHVEKMGE